jgi:hypothetical protein
MLQPAAANCAASALNENDTHSDTPAAKILFIICRPLILICLSILTTVKPCRIRRSGASPYRRAAAEATAFLE